jgi:hypothetical protein
MSLKIQPANLDSAYDYSSLVVSAYQTANAAFTAANSATSTSAGSYANSAFTAANTATNNTSGASLYANGAFNQANAAYTASNTNSTNITTAGSYANSAFTAANTADNKAVTAGSYANSAFTKANTALANTSGTIFGGDLSITGNVTITNTSSFTSSQDKTVSTSPASGTVAYNFYNGTVFDVTPSGSWTVNITSVPTTTNRASVATFIITQGATPYVPAAFQIDGVAQTIKWINNTTPTGNANKVDVISYSMIRTAGGAWVVLGQSGTYG